MLSALTELLCCDPNIRQISVEDPAPAFQRLRDVVSIDRAINRGLLIAPVLFPNSETPNTQCIPWDKHPANSDVWPSYSQVFKTLLLETPHQRRRLRLILTLARLMPSTLLGVTTATVQADSSRGRRRKIPNDSHGGSKTVSVFHSYTESYLYRTCVCTRKCFTDAHAQPYLYRTCVCTKKCLTDAHAQPSDSSCAGRRERGD